MTLLGMGVAFVLLTILVGVVHAMSAIVRLIESDTRQAVPAASTGAVAAPMPERQPVEREIASVVAAAVRTYRNKRAP